MKRTSTGAVTLVAFAALAIAACSGTAEPPPSPPPPAAPDAERIYAAQACAMCHGDEREGGTNGPALPAGDPYWTVERLEDYLRAPGAFRRAYPDFEARRTTAYAMQMPSYAHLEPAALEALARWLHEGP